MIYTAEYPNRPAREFRFDFDGEKAEAFLVNKATGRVMGFVVHYAACDDRSPKDLALMMAGYMEFPGQGYILEGNLEITQRIKERISRTFKPAA